MKIIAKCPRCGTNWCFDGHAADRRFVCNHCHRLFKVPRIEDIPKAESVIRSAKGKLFVDEDGHTYG